MYKKEIEYFNEELNALKDKKRELDSLYEKIHSTKEWKNINHPKNSLVNRIKV